MIRQINYLLTLHHILRTHIFMFKPLVTDEHPVAIYSGIPPQYTDEGLAVDCALVLHVVRGTARIICNFETIEEQPGSVVLFHPGDIIRVQQRSPDFEVEIFGAATLKNESGQVAQVAFGMDNDYRCHLEVWGSQGTLTTDRVLTAPAGFVPEYQIKKNQDIMTGQFSVDDTFSKSIRHFANCIANEQTRISNYNALLKQEELVEEFRNKARQ